MQTSKYKDHVKSLRLENQILQSKLARQENILLDLTENVNIYQMALQIKYKINQNWQWNWQMGRQARKKLFIKWSITWLITYLEIWVNNEFNIIKNVLNYWLLSIN